MNKNITLKIIISFFMIVFLTANFASMGSINTNITIKDDLKDEFEPVGNRIVGVMQVIGILVSVAMTIVVGIKYMLSSLEEKAEYKKTFILYLVGAFLIFATTTIVKIIYNIFS